MIQGWLTALGGNAVLIGLELLVLGLIVATVANILGSRARAMVYAWATQGGWEITDLRRCHLFAAGQFVLPGLPVYRVALKSRSGREREAFVRVGNFMVGALSDELDVEWVKTAGR
jgi:hypothetical protein